MSDEKSTVDTQNKLYEIWSVVEDCGTLQPLFLIDKVNLFELLANQQKYQKYAIIDDTGSVLNNK